VVVPVFAGMKSDIKLFLAFWLLALSSFVSNVNAGPPDSGWTEIWSDEFNGNTITTNQYGLDTNKWSCTLPWVNNGTDRWNSVNDAYWIADQCTYVSNGDLVILNQTSPPTTFAGHSTFNYESGWAQSKTQMSYTWGYAEIRAQYPSGTAMWPTWWLLGDNGSWPPEMDIEERYPNSTMNHGMYYGTNAANAGTWTPGEQDANDTSFFTNMNIYGFDWEPGYTAWYTNGIAHYSFTSQYVPSQPVYVILSGGVITNGSGPGGSGSLANQTFPAYFIIDYVRLYKRDEYVYNGNFSVTNNQPGSYVGDWVLTNATAVSGGGLNGNNALYLTTSANPPVSQVRQIVYGLVPDTTYSFTGNLQSSNGSPIYLGVNGYGGAIIERSTTNTGSYIQRTVSFTTGDTNTLASVYGRLDSGIGHGGYLDELTLWRSAAVADPGFEIGNLSTYWTNGASGSYTISPSNQRSGRRCLQLSSAGSSVQQIIQGLNTNTTYQFSGWVNANNNTIVLGANNFGGPATNELLPSGAGSQTVLINPTTLNGSFEYTDNGPTYGIGPAVFDGITGNEKAGFSSKDSSAGYGPVPNWSEWTTALGGPSTADSDSGVQAIPADATQGDNIAYLQGGNADYDLTSFTIQAGDVFTYSWDWVAAARGTANVELAYWNGATLTGIASTETSAQSNSGKVLGNGTTWTVPVGDTSIGNEIAISVAAPSGANYPEVDNFNLSVAPPGSGAGYNKATITFTTGATNTSAIICVSNSVEAGLPAYVDDLFFSELLSTNWQGIDIGDVTLAGDSGQRKSGTQFVLHGSGSAVGGTADAFRFVYQTLTGDGRITARVLKVDPTDPSARAGIMLRDGTNASSADVALDWQSIGSIEFLRRTNSGEATGSRVISNNIPIDPFVRLERLGNMFTAAWSGDGTNWSVVVTNSSELPQTLNAGLFVNSANATLMNEGIFEHVSIVPYDVNLTAAFVSGNLQLSWPLSASAYNLYSAASLQNPEWTLVTNTPACTHGLITLTLPPSLSSQFFQLQAQ
jgi:beta-glucanase (GH16 family)